MQSSRIFALIVIAAVIGLAAIPVAFFGRSFYNMVNNPYNDHRFEARLWRTASGDRRENPRLRMADDLMKRHLKPGMVREQVRALLGAPDVSSKFDEQQNRDCYGIGNDPAVGIDPEWIAIQYDRVGRIVGMRIERG